MPTVRERVHRIFQRLDPDVEVVALLMGVEPHLDNSFFYATDAVSGGLYERSAALLWRDGRVEVLTTPLEEASARKAPEATVDLFSTNDQKAEWLRSRLNGRRVGYNAPEITMNEFNLLQTVVGGGALVDAQRAILEARLVKDRRELERMQRAADVASEVANVVPGLLRDGLKEFELAAEINYRMQRLGASGPSFQAIVAFGEGSAEPHYASGPVPLRKGEFVLCDFGCLVDRYASDITRTWVYGSGKPEHRQIYETVLRAEQAALDALRPGVKGGDVHLAAAAVIDASPWKGRFIHSVGHSLGLAVHDGGTLHPRYDLTLEEGMVVTIEPGIYVPGFGGVRIEDDVVLTRDGWRYLTSAKKEYLEV